MLNPTEQPFSSEPSDVTQPRSWVLWLQWVVRMGLGVMFVWSGIEKLIHFEAFEQAALNYNLLPPIVTKVYAVMLPWVEILAGGYLIVGFLTRFAAGLVVAMMLSFLVAIGVVLVRGDAIDCGCMIGGQSEPVTWWKFAEDVGLLGLAAMLIRWPLGALSMDRWLQQR